MNQKLYELLEKSGFYSLATINENGEPRIRIFGSKAIIDDNFCICMGKQKNVYKEIINNPKIAITGHIKDYNWFRAYANAIEITDRYHKDKMFEAMPQLKSLYENNDDNFCIFKLEDLTVEEF